MQHSLSSSTNLMFIMPSEDSEVECNEENVVIDEITQSEPTSVILRYCKKEGTKTSTTWPPTGKTTQTEPKKTLHRKQHKPNQKKLSIENEPKIVNFNWLAKQKPPPPPPPPKLEHSFSGRSCASWAWLDCGQMPSTGTWPPCWDTCSRSRCWRCSSQATCCSICPDFAETAVSSIRNNSSPTVVASSYPGPLRRPTAQRNPPPPLRRQCWSTPGK
uniref:(northern house mosquito) hypothetical protein n=1 Tax=Culex pipiens TaxID=7175 RepID=A0A8D8IK57_CULPI